MVAMLSQTMEVNFRFALLQLEMLNRFVASVINLYGMCSAFCDVFFVLFIRYCKMAADLLGMAFIPYYRHIMHILESDKSLKQTIQGMKVSLL